MSHTTYSYTRDKLGFEPDREERRLTHYAGVQPTYTNGNGHHNGHNGQYQEDTMTGGVYEENLSKFKGLLLCSVISIRQQLEIKPLF